MSRKNELNDEKRSSFSKLCQRLRHSGQKLLPDHKSRVENPVRKICLCNKSKYSAHYKIHETRHQIPEDTEIKNKKRKAHCRAYLRCRNEGGGLSHRERLNQKKNRSIQTTVCEETEKPLDVSKSTRFSSSLLQQIDRLLRNKSNAQDETDYLPTNRICSNDTKMSRQTSERKLESDDKKSLESNGCQNKIKEERYSLEEKPKSSKEDEKNEKSNGSCELTNAETSCGKRSKIFEHHNDMMSLMRLQCETKQLCEQVMEIAQKYNCKYYTFDNDEILDFIWTEWRQANQQLIQRKKEILSMKDEIESMERNIHSLLEEGVGDDGELTNWDERCYEDLESELCKECH